MHGAILVLAKKKAAGPGGYFDPMAEKPEMAQGPMMFQVSEPQGVGPDEPTEEEEGYDVQTADKAKGSPSMDLKSIIADLKATAMKLDQLAQSGAIETEDEPPGQDDEPAAEAKPEPKAKKSVPAFLKKSEMKY